jgi:nucleotide-binding universal stress UspA family protein
MATPRTLVLGDDGSAAADTAWQWIISHRWPGWRVVAATAAVPPIGPPVEPELAALHPWEPPSPRVAPASAEIDAVEHLTAVADPRVLLGEFPGADLVVVGPTGRGVLKALHLGSTADWLVEDPTGPVVVARAPRPGSPVLLCVDGSAHSTQAMQVVADLPCIAGTDVVVLAVSDGRSDPSTAVDRAVPVLEAAGAAVTTREIEGKPTRVILEQIDAHGADLVALGTRGLTRLRRMFTGSTTSAVTRGAPCSVMVVSAPES